MDKNKISIIVPVYNTARYLPRCVRSILTQTYRNLEILLIDDGSTDDSGALCDNFAEMDPRVRVIHKDNMGVSAARNDGIKAASGDYLAFVDSDDVISDNMIAVLHNLSVCYSAEIAMCGWEKLREGTEMNTSKTKIQTGVFGKKEAMSNIITTWGYGGFLCNKLFCTELFREPELLWLDTDIYVCEDMLMTCQLVERADRIAYTTEKLYGYVVRGDSATEKITNKTFSSLVAKERMIEIYSRNGLPDAHSVYAYSIANLMTFEYSDVVRENFEELLTQLKRHQNFFIPELHSIKEKVLFFTISAMPHFFSYLYSSIRFLRSILWKRNQ